MSIYERLKDRYPEVSGSLFDRFGIECHDGWYEVVEFAFAVFDKAREFGPAELRQVKEKFGAIRVYGSAPKELKQKNVLTTLLEAWSLLICDLCGQPGSRRKGMGWVATRCDQHDGFRGKVAFTAQDDEDPTIPSFGHKLCDVHRNDQGDFVINLHELPEIMTVGDFFKSASDFPMLDSGVVGKDSPDIAKAVLLKLAEDGYAIVTYDDFSTHQAIYNPSR